MNKTIRLDVKKKRQDLCAKIDKYFHLHGEWPSISMIAEMKGQKHAGSMCTTVKRMVNDGWLEYATEFCNGNPRLVKTV